MPELENHHHSDDIIKDFEEMTKVADRIQKDVLRRILEQNKETEYLRRFDLNGRSDPETFKKRVPIVTHPDIQSFVQRIVEGDKSPILTAAPVEALCLSSGTTNGSPKYIPLYKEILEATQYLAKLGPAYRSGAYPIKPDGRILEFAFAGRIVTTSGGLIAGTGTTHLFRSEEFKTVKQKWTASTCSPDAVIFGSDCHQSMYCHLLCGLLYSEEVECITSTFAYSIVEAFRTFEEVWQDLCNDIREGILNAKITDPNMRHAISNILRPQPELAESITRKCESLVSWQGVIPEVWPNCKYIYSIMTGSMEPYLKRLQNYAGDLPLVSTDYGATECWIAVNTNPRSPPHSASFTVVPSFGYFEFLPQRYRCEGNDEMEVLNSSSSVAEDEELDTVGLTEVKVGQDYEIVVTTYGGFYRYRLGDVVRVTGFYNSSPQLSFVYRKNVFLNIHIDKNTEKDLSMVVSKACNLLPHADLNLVDFTSYADLSTTPGHYVIFWELKDNCIDENILHTCASLLDKSFVDPGYVGSRSAGTIGALELCIVQSGTFRKLLDRYLSRGVAAIAQYKTPRCITSKESVNLLQSSKLRSFFSSEFGQ
eukprot:c25826_g1_i1 orf=273-2051(+)